MIDRSDTGERDTAPVASPGMHARANRIFKFSERFLLIVIAIMTLVATGAELWSVLERGEVDLADILLMFLYLEVLGMIAVFYTGQGESFVYPIFIAITALARLIVLQGKDMAPENVVYEAGAVLLLSCAAFVIVRAHSH